MSQLRKIGSLLVSSVGVGCNNFGVRLDQAGTQKVVDAAIDAGINFFDTADVYGETRSEEYLGRALGERRRSLLIATKFGLPLDEQRKGARPEYVRSALEASLRRLGTDYVDLYQLHRPDPEVPIEDTLGALHELVQAGKVREIGCSNFSVEQIEASTDAVRRARLSAFASIQNEYSLLARAPEQGVLPAAERAGLGFLPYFPLASGLLSGKYRTGLPSPEGTRLSPGSPRRDRFLNAKSQAIADELDEFARAHGHSLLELAFSWLLSHGAVASVIAGATAPAQVKANAAAPNWVLNAEELRALDEITLPAPLDAPR